MFARITIPFLAKYYYGVNCKINLRKSGIIHSVSMFIFHVTPEKPQKKSACLSGELFLQFSISYKETSLNPPKNYALSFMSLCSTIGCAVIRAKLFVVHNPATYETICLSFGE